MSLENINLIGKEQIINTISLDDIKDDLTNNLKDSNLIFSILVLASRNFYSKNKNSVYLSNKYNETSKSNFVQDGKVIDDNIISLASDSFTYFGNLSGVSSFYELIDLSNNTQDFVNLVRHNIGKGLSLNERQNVNRNYADSEIKRLDKILKSNQECFHKDEDSDEIICKKCNQFKSFKESSALFKDETIKNFANESLFEQALYIELNKVPRNLQNPNNKKRTPVYSAKELVLLVVRACVVSFPTLSYSKLKKIIYKILDNYHNSSPIYIEEKKHDESGSLDYFEFYETSLFGENRDEDYKVIELMDFNVNKIIKENFDEVKLACIASEMKIAFKTNRELAEYLNKSEETARNLKNQSIEEMRKLINEISNGAHTDFNQEDLEYFAKHFTGTLVRYIQSFFSEDVVNVT